MLPNTLQGMDANVAAEILTEYTAEGLGVLCSNGERGFAEGEVDEVAASEQID